MPRSTLRTRPSEAELAWAEHGTRQDIARRYFAALQARDLDAAANIWLEAGDYDRANPASSSLRDELDYPDRRAA